jgi:hypothetical protein
MARNDIYLNINSLSVADAVVTGQQDMTAATIPELVLGDTPTFNFYFTDNTNVWPSWAGNASYSLTWALSDAVSGDFTPAATTGNATPITGGWSVVLPLNSYDLVGLLNSKRVGQPYPVQNLWQQLRVTDPSGNEVTRAMFWTPVRYRAISDTQNTESASPTGGRFVTVNNVNTLTTPTAAQFYAANLVPTSALGTAANGELLIGNGTGFTKATLTAGSGVSITNGSGSITITATDGDITLDDGTAAAPSLKFTADTDTGLFRPSDNVVGISAGGVSRATFGATSAINGTTIPASKTLVVTTDKLSALAATTSAELAGVISDETGTGALVFATSPTLTTPILGTPQSGTLSSCTGLPISTGVSGLGTNVASALGTNVGSAGAFVVNGGALGTPSSGTLTYATGLPISTGVSGLGSGMATFLATPSSANLASAVTDETGTGALVFANTPTLVTPNIGAATGTSVNLSGAGTFGGNLTVSGSAVSGGYYVGTGNSGAFEGKTSAAGTMVSVGVWNTSTSANSDAGFSLNTQTSRSASWVLRRSTGLLEMHDAYQTTGTSRFSIDPLNGNTIVGGNLTVSGGTVTSGTGTLTLNSSANTVVLQSAGTTALTLDSSQRAQFAGNLGLGAAPLSYMGIRNSLSLTASSGVAYVYQSGGTLTTSANNDQIFGMSIDNGYSNTGSYTNISAGHLQINAQSFSGIAFGYGIRIGNITGATNNYAIRTGSGIVSFEDTTASTATNSGALRVSGGVGVAGAINVGTFYGMVDGVTAPSATSGYAKIYVDTADGDLKVIFGDGTIKTIATDS